MKIHGSIDDFDPVGDLLTANSAWQLNTQPFAPLENTHMPIGQIATTLDYSEASAFNHAFRRWSGTTPAAWRARRLTE